MFRLSNVRVIIIDMNYFINMSIDLFKLMIKYISPIKIAYP